MIAGSYAAIWRMPRNRPPAAAICPSSTASTFGSEPCHLQHVAGVELVEQAAKLRAVGLGSARHFAEHLTRPVLPQRRDLSGHALAVRRYPGIAVFHALLMAVIYAKEKPFCIKALIFLHNS